MPPAEERRRVTVVSACMRASGLPDFALAEVEVTAEDYANGVQYDLAEELLVAAGFEEPFVHYETVEAPPFLIPAVRRYLGLPLTRRDPNHLVALEES